MNQTILPNLADINQTICKHLDELCEGRMPTCPPNTDDLNFLFTWQWFLFLYFVITVAFLAIAIIFYGGLGVNRFVEDTAIYLGGTKDDLIRKAERDEIAKRIGDIFWEEGYIYITKSSGDGDEKEKGEAEKYCKIRY